MKRRGFTLVELLIVIVVIGVLSAMMMLSSTEAVTSARASNIVSNLRNLKTAATAMYVDRMDYPTLTDGLYTGQGKSIDVAVKYMNNGASSGGTSDANLNNYGMTTVGTKWYVYVSGVAENVQTKLKGRAQSVGLVTIPSETGATSVTSPYNGGSIVGMEVLDTNGLANTTTGGNGGE